MKRLAPVMALSALCACAMTGPPPKPDAEVEAPPSGPLRAIRNVQIFDGTQLRGVGNVVFQGSRLLAVGPDAGIPTDATVVDGTGKTVMPGLIDAHAHVWDYSQLRQEAVFGVTTVLDMMNSPGSMIGIRRALASNSDLADFRSAGAAATVPGGHGTQYGFPVPTLTQPSEAAEFVEQRVSEGSQYIKIMYDDGKAHGFDWPTLSLPTVKALIDAAHQAGKAVVVHIGSLREAREVIAAGADGLAHTIADYPADPEFVSLVASHHAFVVATLSATLSSTGVPPGTELAASSLVVPFLPKKELAALQGSFPAKAGATIAYANAAASVMLLTAAGVPVLAGTDAANPGVVYGASLHGELELLVKAGMTPTQALRAATSAPADSFKLADRGRLRAGARSDLLLLDADPTADITATKKIAGIWVAGVPLDREAYRAQYVSIP
jgi:imidazolonepropionase-like amidohydrolase